MKALAILPLALAVGFASIAQTGKPRPKSKTVYSNKLLALATRELTVKNLRQQYRKELSVKKVSANQHDPTVKDTLLAVNTPMDKLQVFTNEYNSFLVSASFTSPRLSFGNGIKIGTSQASFCKVYGQSQGFNIYQIVGNPDGGFDISFEFRQGKLVKVVCTIDYID